MTVVSVFIYHTNWLFPFIQHWFIGYCVCAKCFSARWGHVNLSLCGRAYILLQGGGWWRERENTENNVRTKIRRKEKINQESRIGSARRFCIFKWGGWENLIRKSHLRNNLRWANQTDDIWGESFSGQVDSKPPKPSKIKQVNRYGMVCRRTKQKPIPVLTFLSSKNCQIKQQILCLSH